MHPSHQEPSPLPSETSSIAPPHAKWLEDHGVSIQLAAAHGVRSVMTEAELPEEFREHPRASVPALLFEWQSPRGEIVLQLRPDNPPEINGRRAKYIFPIGQRNVLNRVDPARSGDTVVIVEGTKQAMVAAEYAPDGFEIYGMPGCYGWCYSTIEDDEAGRRNGVAIPDLKIAKGKKVVVILDADAATNTKVFDGGTQLAGALRTMHGAVDVRFARMEGARGTAGLDDVFVTLDRENRAEVLHRMIEEALRDDGTATEKKHRRMPADKRPPEKTDREKRVVASTEGRVKIDVSGDKLGVIDAITDALTNRWNGRRLFDFAMVLTQLREARTEPLVKGTFVDILAETAVTYVPTENGEAPAWPDGYCIEAAMVGRVGQYALLEKLSRVPFVRSDGTICQSNGYDQDSHTFLTLDPELQNIVVPDEPAQDQVRDAVALLLDDWLGDMPFPDQASRANALALVLTPFIRGLVPLAPLAVIDGLQMGVGKGLFGDILSLLVTGKLSEPLPFNDDDNENRKLVTSAFRAGTDLFLFDEAHVIEGKHLARTITSPTYKDRILGVSTMAEFPNRCTWASMGNNVQINGDMARRVYRIALRPTGDSPETRSSSTFRHPDLKGWTRQNRARLLTACLTLVRAWFAAGCPEHDRGWQMGSFEAWDRMVGGILHHAGVGGFLDNIREWRSRSDFETSHWTAHLHWLVATFGTKTFYASQAAKELSRPNADVEAPPGLEDTSPKNYSRELGKAYSKVNGRKFSGMRLEDRGPGAGDRLKWVVVTDTPPDQGKVGCPDDGPATDSGPKTDDTVPDQGERGGKSGESVESVATTPRVSEKTPSRANTCVSRGSGVLATDSTDLTDSSQVNAGVQAQSVGSATDAQSTSADFPQVTRGAGPAASTVVGPRAPVIGTLALDLETAGAEMTTLFSSGPEYVRLGGLRADQGEVEVTTDLATVVDKVVSAETVVGHNIMGFDMIALARHGGVDIRALAEENRLVDTLLLARLADPPLSRGNDGDKHGKKYDLDALGERLLGHKKHGDLSALALEFADPSLKRKADRLADGYTKIPVDDPRYVEYLRGDVLLTDDLMDKLPYTEYAAREHRVAALCAGITVNGFRVDVPLLRERYDAGEARRAELVAKLVRDYELPLTKKDGKPAANPAATNEGKAAIERALLSTGVPADALPRTAKTQQVSLGKENAPAFLEEYAEAYPGIVDIVEAVGSLLGIRSIYGTALDHLVGDRVHPVVDMRQSTGRLSITKPGLTVFGKRGGKAVERAIFLPDSPDHVLISADLSQIDARAVAAWSQDENYMAMFEPGKDLHGEVAQAVFGDRSLRELAKPLSHGSNYGLGLKGFLKRNPKVDPELAAKFYEMMPVQFPGVEAWKESVRYRAEYGELLDNGFGRLLRVDPERAYTAAPAAVGQSTARDLMMEGLLRLPLDVAAMIRAIVHDEVVLSVPRSDVGDIERVVLDALSFEWTAPGKTKPIQIVGDVSERGDCWAGVYSADYCPHQG